MPVSHIDRSPALSLEVYVFPKSNDWTVEPNIEQPELSKIFPVPGTWARDLKSTGAKHDGIPKEILAIVSCPNCHNALVLHDRIQKIDHKGKVSPDFHCNHCKFHRRVYLDEFHNKPLWACAIERFERSKIIPEIIYCQGLTESEARFNLGNLRNNQRLVAIGRAIGFMAANKDGSELAVDNNSKKLVI